MKHNKLDFFSDFLIIWKALKIMLLLVLIGGLQAYGNTGSKKTLSLENDVIEQQSVPVEGMVTDEQGSPLPGVTVLEKSNPSNGAVTNTEGHYSIEVGSEESVLIFSMIGFGTQEITVGNQRSINVQMVEELYSLDEVVAVGYGTMRRSDLSGASATVKADDLKDMPVTNIAHALQGRVAGVSVVQNTGTPGAESKIRIRGANSMLGSNSPLIILDGIAMNIPLSALNPDDIESMEILKDASSTAIYGSRGANGVIVIQTRRGKSGQMDLNISSDYSFDQVANKYDLLNAAGYAELINEMNATEIFTPAEIEDYRRNGGTDWQDQLFQQGYKSRTAVSLTGGSNKAQYYLSGSYLDQKSLVVNAGQKRYFFRSKVDTDIGKRLHVALDLSLTRTSMSNTSDGSGSKDSPIWQSLIWSPTEPVFDDQGNYNQTDQYGSIAKNPYMMAMERMNDGVGGSSLLNTNIQYKLLDHLTLSAVLGMSNTDWENASFTNSYISSTTGASRSYNNSLFLQGSSYLTYENIFNDKHRLTVMAGAEESSSTSKWFGANGTNLITESVGYHNLALNASQSISSGWSRWALRSYLGRIAYSFNEKYFMTATFRRDGSSRFQEDNKFSNFPSAAISWRLSEESFIQNLNIFSNLKARASWGITGNQAIPPYGTIALLSSSYYSYGTPTAMVGYSPSGAPNPDLRWEETTQLNFGLDAAVFGGRLYFTFDYFDKLTDGLLQSVALPAYNGGGSTMQNTGEIANKGVELSAGAYIVSTSNLQWNTNLTFTSIKNEVISIGDEEMIFPGSGYASGFLTDRVYVVMPEEPLGTFYGYKFLGIWQADEAAEAAGYGNNPGDSKYEDRDGNGTIDGNDMQIIGHALPKFTWGLNNTISYRNFDFNLMIEGVHGREVMNLGYAAAAVAVGDARSITLAESADGWSTSNPSNMWPSVASSTNTDHINSSKWLQDGSYIKVRNISVSYRLTKEKIRFADLILSLSAQNILTITNYEGFDPEVTSTGNSDIDQGLDIGSFPTPRSITVGVKMNF